MPLLREGPGLPERSGGIPPTILAEACPHRLIKRRNQIALGGGVSVQRFVALVAAQHCRRWPHNSAASTNFRTPSTPKRVHKCRTSYVHILRHTFAPHF